MKCPSCGFKIEKRSESDAYSKEEVDEVVEYVTKRFSESEYDLKIAKDAFAIVTSDNWLHIQFYKPEVSGVDYRKMYDLLSQIEKELEDLGKENVLLVPLIT